MKKLFKVLLWVVFNSAFIVLGYFGLVEGVVFCKRAFVFWFWSNVVISILGGMLLCRKEESEKVTRSVPAIIDVSRDVIIAVCLAGISHPWMASATFVAMVFQASIYKQESK